MRRTLVKTVIQLSDISDYILPILKANIQDDKHYIKIVSAGDSWYHVEHNGVYHPKSVNETKNL